MDIEAHNDPIDRSSLLSEQAKKPRLTILLAGKTAVNQSGQTEILPPVERVSVKVGTQQILEVAKSERVINNLPCQILCIPDLGDISLEYKMDPAYREELKLHIKMVHVIWFVTYLDEAAINSHEKNAIQWINTLLGEGIWASALLVMIRANPAKKSLKNATLMKEKSEKFRAEISKSAGWDIARSMTSVLVNSLDEILADERTPEISSRIMRSIDPHGDAHQLFAAPQSTLSPLSQRRMTPFSTKDKPSAFMFFYVTSAPLGAAGMCIAGPKGFGIAVVGNAAFWVLFNYLQSLRTS